MEIIITEHRNCSEKIRKINKNLRYFSNLEDQAFRVLHAHLQFQLLTVVLSMSTFFV